MADRRLHDASARQRAVTLEGEAERGGLARNGHRGRAVHIRAALHRRPQVHTGARTVTHQLEHVGARTERSARGTFDRYDRAIGAADHETRDATDAAGEWL